MRGQATFGVSDVACPRSSVVPFPTTGALRVNPTPDQLPSWRRIAERGPYRFDDPKEPGSFRVRYLATTLRGCLLEILAQFRPKNDETDALLGAVDFVDDDHLHPDIPKRGVADYLALQRVGSCQLFDAGDVVSIHDFHLLAELDRQLPIRYLLENGPGLQLWDRNTHLDEAKVRLDAELGRRLTQQCARAIFSAAQQPAGIHYRSKHDDAEDCWALFDRARVTFTHTVNLDPGNPEHFEALNSVAMSWQLPLPPVWQEAQSQEIVLPRASRRSSAVQ
jgi:RES domain